MKERAQRLLRDAASSLAPHQPRPLSQAELKHRIDRNMAAAITSVQHPSQWTRVTARNWAAAADSLLDMPPVTIRWSIASLAELGSFDRREPHIINISPRISPRDIGRAVLHEEAHRFRHLNQMVDSEPLVEADTRWLMARIA